jgi:hypothetical protein
MSAQCVPQFWQQGMLAYTYLGPACQPFLSQQGHLEKAFVAAGHMLAQQEHTASMTSSGEGHQPGQGLATASHSPAPSGTPPGYYCIAPSRKSNPYPVEISLIGRVGSTQGVLPSLVAVQSVMGQWML